MKQNPTTAIKCKFSNAVHKMLEPNTDIKQRDRWRHRDKLHAECSKELTTYQYDRREKKRVQKARIARGYVPKKKTKKDDYLKAVKSA